MLCGFFLIFGYRAEAQTAVITGTVTDSTGGAIPKAQVSVKNEATGVLGRTASTDTGVYQVDALPSGTYSLIVDKTGFETMVRSGITLTVDTTTRVDATLSVHGASAVVEVRADAAMLDTSTPESATTITQDEFNDLALIQIDRYRNPSNFVYLAPGTEGNFAPSGAANTAATNYIDVHGGQSQTVELYIEGMQAGQMRTVGSFTEMSPPVDAVREFKFTTAFVGAQYGHTGDAVGSFTLNSGTNNLHGSAYEYLRNSVMDARPFGALSKPSSRQNEFGATIGGPVFIPHLYNGHNRTFFFFAYGGSRKGGADNLQNLTIPTQAEIGGDFSAVSTKIYDPSTTTLQANGTYTRKQFSGNKILSGIDPVAAAIAKYFPKPNVSGSENYQTFDGEEKLDPNIFVFKVDHQINSNNRVSVSMVSTNNPRLLVSYGLPEPLWDVSRQTTGGKTARINYDLTLGANKLNSLILGLNRFTNLDTSPEPGTNWPQTLGLSGVNGGLFPYIDFASNGYTIVGRPEEGDHVEDTYAIRDTFMWTVGSHSLQTGAELRRVNFNDTSPSPENSEFQFSNLETDLPGSTSTGNSFASFLLGQVNVATVTAPYEIATRYNYAGFFVQDSYKASSRLTLVGGLRWEFQTPPYEKNNHSSVVSLTEPNPSAGNLPGALAFAGKGGPGFTGRRSFVNTDYSGLSGRVGMSVGITPTTLFRAGYGVYYTDYGLTIASTGYQARANIESTNNGVSPALLLQNGVPATTSLSSPTPTPDLINGQSASYMDSDAGAMPRIQEWTANLQQTIGKNWLLQLSYIGNHGSRLINPDMVNINQVNPKYLSLGAVLSDPVGSAPANAAGIKAPYAGFTGSVAQALRPYPQYLTLTSTAAKAGASIYNGLEFVAQKRFSGGFTFGGSYVYSKSLGDSGGAYGGTSTDTLEDAYNPQPGWSLLPIDVTHQVILHYIYQLPFGRGQHWLNHGGWTNAALGGWRFTAIQRYQSGFPIMINRSNSLPIFNYVLRPNIVPGVAHATHISIHNWVQGKSSAINKAAFVSPAAYSFGDARPSYDDLRQFAILDEDLAVIKQFKVGERVTWNLYGQFFNAPNRHRFTTIDGDFTDSGFGESSGVSSPRQVQLGTRVTF
jgi:hypothetical protein